MCIFLERVRQAFLLHLSVSFAIAVVLGALKMVGIPFCGDRARPKTGKRTEKGDERVNAWTRVII